MVINFDLIPLIWNIDAKSKERQWLQTACLPGSISTLILIFSVQKCENFMNYMQINITGHHKMYSRMRLVPILHNSETSIFLSIKKIMNDIKTMETVTNDKLYQIVKQEEKKNDSYISFIFFLSLSLFLFHIFSFFFHRQIKTYKKCLEEIGGHKCKKYT